MESNKQLGVLNGAKQLNICEYELFERNSMSVRNQAFLRGKRKRNILRKISMADCALSLGVKCEN